ncbi:MAG: hypothetical protein Q9207_002785 [Kuettlingeria erythrocarpa]
MNGTVRIQFFPTPDASDTDGSITSSSSTHRPEFLSPSVSDRLQHFMEGSPFALDEGSTSGSHATTPATEMIERERRFYLNELPPFVQKRFYPKMTHLPQTLRLVDESGEYTGTEIHINIRDWDQEHIYLVSLVNGEERVLQIDSLRRGRLFRVWLGHETGASDTILAHTGTALGPQQRVNWTKRSATSPPIPETTGKTHHFNDADVGLRRSKRGKPSEKGQRTATGKLDHEGKASQAKDVRRIWERNSKDTKAYKKLRSHTNLQLAKTALQREHLLKCVAYLAEARRKRPFRSLSPTTEQAIAGPPYTETNSHLNPVPRLGEPTPREFLLRSKLDALSELGRRRELGLDEIESKIRTCDQLLEIEESKLDIHVATSG